MITKITVVVVTFNRKEYLIKCLNALLLQTVALSKILIVDNASTDGTQAYINESGLLKNDIFQYINLVRNIGGAGGFNVGLNEGLKTDANWFWVMDDDVAPLPNCLENLLNFKTLSECIHPSKMLVNGDEYIWEHQIDILTGSRTLTGNKSFKNGKEITFTNVACFEGMLVTRRIIDKIGLPDIKYFISDDDTLFGIKASVHTNVAYVSAAKIRKLIPLGVTTPWKSYYVVRNRFYLFCDACKYLDIKPSRLNTIIFIAIQTLNLLRMFKLGVNFVCPSFRGFRHGIAYWIDS